MKWYLRRLRAMSLPEVLWRIGQKAQAILDYLRMVLRRRRVIPHGQAEALLEHSPELVHSGVGNTPAAIAIFDLEFPPGTTFDWHRDYYTSTNVAPRFAHRHNTRNTAEVGDIKYIWEINRHQYLSALAFTEWGRGHSSAILAALADWVRRNPYLIGVNWISSLELALRSISWTLILHRFRDEAAESPALGPILGSLESQLGHLYRNLSRYSSANNHLIGEAAGLYVCAVAFPGLKKARHWRRHAKTILEREIIKQVTHDGINREQSTSYHLFTLEFLLLAYILGTNSGDTFSDTYTSRLKYMLSYLSAIATGKGDLPAFGDSDDGRGFLVSFDESAFDVAMQLGGLLFRESAYLRFSAAPGLTGRLLLGESAVDQYQVAKARPSRLARPPMIFKQGGKAILGDHHAKIKAVMDFGEHGYLSLAAHGHADALSVQLAVDDRYVLIDPGTYAYHSHQPWRNYFRGTAAHNTVRVDGLDQSVIGGRFLWTHKANSRLVEWQTGEEVDVCIAEHDGYRRLKDPVIHRRRAGLDKSRRVLVLTDTLACRDRHYVEVFFHLHEDCHVEEHSSSLVVARFRERTLTFSGERKDFSFTILRGEEDPIAGWHSSSFHRKLPINTLCYSGYIHGTTRITTKASMEFQDS